MSKDRDYVLFLEDILESIGKIEKYTEGLTYQEFHKDEMVIDAVVRNFEIIGEAVNKVPEELKEQYPFVEWNEAVGFRNVMIHEYFGVDTETVWETVQNNIPALKEKISRIIKAETKKDTS